MTKEPTTPIELAGRLMTMVLFADARPLMIPAAWKGLLRDLLDDYEASKAELRRIAAQRSAAGRARRGKPLSKSELRTKGRNRRRGNWDAEELASRVEMARALIAEGSSQREAARAVQLSPSTMRRAMEKMQAAKGEIE